MHVDPIDLHTANKAMDIEARIESLSGERRDDNKYLFVFVMIQRQDETHNWQ